MAIRIALAGNPNSGKTTLFNALTGSNQFVGNWPGVTVEKKEGNLRERDDVIVTDLPGIYSLAPYSPEEMVARRYLAEEHPDVILNIVDASNLERNLYLTTQLLELGIPTVIALNMMDMVRRAGDSIDLAALSSRLGCPIIPISALRGEGIEEVKAAALAAVGNRMPSPRHIFSGAVEHTLAHIEEAVLHAYPPAFQRFYAIKIFERDRAALDILAIPPEMLLHIEEDIVACEAEMDDDAESIIINERYLSVERMLRGVYRKVSLGLTPSDKIDRVMTNRFAALPIFAAIMFLVYYISVTTVGGFATDWANDGLFGDGFFFLGKGSAKYEAAVEDYTHARDVINAFVEYADEKNINTADVTAALGADTVDRETAKNALVALDSQIEDYEIAPWQYEDEESFEQQMRFASGADLTSAIETAYGYGFAEPDPTAYGWWVHGVPIWVERGLTAANAPVWLESLILDGIVGGVGAVLGFVPQILVLFLLLGFLESCGYMARIAFVLDRIFRKFGLSGKSFIPILVGMGCGVPGIMASRTIENESDRRMTVITTTFIPCGAKLPVIAMVTAAFFGGAEKGWWLAPVCYFIGVAAIVLSGILLKKTRLFAGDPAPFVMELPAYHLPTVGNLLRSVWERGWSFVKKAGTIILLSTVIIWLGTVFGVANGSFGFYAVMPEGGKTVLDYIGGAISWIFAPLGFNDPTAAVATLMGLVAKEEIVAVFGVADFAGMSRLAGLSFLTFNLLCAPCFAAMGAIRREMNSAKWTAFAIGYQCLLAYAVSLMIYQIGSVFTGNLNVIGLIAALLVLGCAIFLLVRKPYQKRKGEKI